MKVVAAGDFHGDWVTAGVARYDEIAAAAEHTVRVAIEEKAGLYIFLGDLAEPEGPGMLRTLELAVRMAGELWQAGIQSLWLTGNHDVIEDGHRTSNLNPLRDVAGATLADQPMLIPFGPLNPKIPIVNVLALPFTPRTHGYDPREIPAIHFDKRVHIVAGHLMLEGIAAGSETTDMARGRDVFWPLAEIKRTWPDAICIAGHYHDCQVYNGVHVAGSLARLTRSEVGNTPSFLVLDV